MNSYGRDLTLAQRRDGGEGRIRPLFAELLRAVGGIEGIRRVRYTSPHPKDLRPETIAAMAEVPAVCEHLHLPLQSGSDRVLAAMHRGYTGERYLEKLAAARAAVPDLAVTTDIIVGFPGETDDDFDRTLEVAAAAEYDSAYTFIYSPRPGTEAAESGTPLVDPGVVAERFERLRVVVDRSGLAQARGPRRVASRRSSSRARRSATPRSPRGAPGRTSWCTSPHPSRCASGTYATVEITGAAPHFLRGELARGHRGRGPPHAHPRRLGLSGSPE